VPTLKLKATKMVDAKVNFVSLVERGANRIPFRIIKKEKDMTTKKSAFRDLDLANLFASKKGEKEKPVVIGYVTMKGDNYEAVVKGLKEAGVDVSQPVELADKSVIFKQGDVEVDPEQTVVIKANDEVALIVKGFCPYDMQMSYGEQATFEEVCKAQGFYPGVRTMLDVLASSVMTLASKADAPDEAATDIAAMFDEAKAYVTQMVSDLPVVAFKAEVLKFEAAKQFTPTDPPSKNLFEQGTPGANSGIVPNEGDTMTALLGKFKGSLALFSDAFPKLAADTEKDSLLKAFAAIDLAYQSLTALKGSGVTYTPPVANVASQGDKNDAAALGAQAAGDKGNGAVTAAAAGGVTEHKDEKKPDTAAPDFAKIVAEALAPMVAKMDKDMKALTDKVTTSIGEVNTQVTEAVTLAKKSDERIRNVILTGAVDDDDDPVGVKKGIKTEYVGREFDTAFTPGVRKSARN
jgi:hypothetical protein